MSTFKLNKSHWASSIHGDVGSGVWRHPNAIRTTSSQFKLEVTATHATVGGQKQWTAGEPQQERKRSVGPVSAPADH